MLQKEMQFKKIAIISIFSVVISGTIGIYMAHLGWGAKSLVVQSLSATLLSGLGFKLAYKWNISFAINKKSLKKLMGFGMALMGARILNYWTRNTDNLLIGKFLGDTSLGLYNRSYTFLLIPVSIISVVFGQVLFPLMSKNQNDKKLLKEIFVSHLKLIILMMLPVSLLAFLLSEELVLGLLGEKWIRLVPLFKAFSPLIFIQCISTINGVIYNALGKTKLLLKVSLLVEMIIIIAVIVGIQFNIMGVIYALYIATAINFYPSFTIPYNLINLKFTDVLYSSWKIVLSGVVAFILTALLKFYVISISSQYGGEISELIFFSATYLIAMVMLLFFTKEPLIKSIISKTLKRIF
jgi:PST family polysaccharide transporter